MNKTIQGAGHVFYPDSCPIENIIEYVLPIYPCAISPIHDKDKNKDGSLKKAHYHLLFQGKLTEKDKKYISKFTGINYYESIYDFLNAYGYLYHYNIRENIWYSNKTAYWKIDIKYSERWSDDYVLRFSENRTNNIYDFNSLLTMVRDKEFTEMYQLYDFALDNPNTNAMDIICKYSTQFERYIKSYRFSQRDNGVSIRAKLLDELFEDTKLLEIKKGCYIDLRSYKTALEMKYQEEKFFESLSKIPMPIDIEE